ncbi:MAG: glycoside hydrolase family 25 protein [Ruminococcus sp.]|nr:glycoside hydrolase family 25 protein [Ruminococcus sp.]
MKLNKTILSLLLSCTFVCSAVPSVSFAADTTIYDSTISDESKEAVSQDKNASGAVPFNVFDIYDAHQGYLAEHPEYSVPSLERDCLGIDVSQWQGNVDWAAVKASGVEFVILRAGYGKFSNQVDIRFRENIEAAKAVGLDCGVYWYSYALTTEDALREAEVCCEIIDGYDLQYPVYFDIEDPSQQSLSTAQTSAIIETFCSAVAEKGYYPGIYSYASFLSTKVFTEVLQKYDVWVAHFNVDTPSFAGAYGMWQYSSTGTVDGITGDVDLDHCYRNYPYIVSPDNYVAGLGQTVATTTTAPSADPGIAQGIDVSVWQYEINWDEVASEDVDYAIVRAGYGRFADQKDTMLDVNINGAHAAGLDVGVYWYSYADSPEAAVLEAEACYEVIKDYKLEYPVYFDIEDPSISNKSPEELTAITEAFCSTLEAKGYYVGITSYSNFLNYKLLPSVFEKYDVWVAHYSVMRPSFNKNYGMWQYSSTGRIAGIDTCVDLDYCYTEYPEIITSSGLNGYGDIIADEDDTAKAETADEDTAETEEAETASRSEE